MSKLKLTLGMAVFDDHPGCWMTIQALRSFHRDVLHQCELIVVDNHPDSDHGRAVRGLVENMVRGDFLKARYVPFTDYNSTAKPRQMVFDLAEAPYVACMDSHILLPRGPDEVSCLQCLIDWYDDHPQTANLLQGPLVYDNLINVSTHFADNWREEMWGTWDTDPAGENPNHPPFEIPAQGLGLFSTRKEIWDAVGGFNPLFRGFGGEEWYIHEKFRQYGQRMGVDGTTLCLPWLRWVHRFGHVGGVQYPLQVVDKIRNYIIGHQELKLPMTRVIKHFVTGKNEDGSRRKGPSITPHQWNHLIHNLATYPVPPFPPEPKAGAGGITSQTEAQRPQMSFLPDDKEFPEYEEMLTQAPNGCVELFPALHDVFGGLPQFGGAMKIVLLLKHRWEPLLAAINQRGYMSDAETPLSVTGYVEQSRGELARIIQQRMEKNEAGDALHYQEEQTQLTIYPYYDLEQLQAAAESGSLRCDLCLIEGRYQHDELYPLLKFFDPLADRIAIIGSNQHSESITVENKPRPAILPAVRHLCLDNPAWGVVKSYRIGSGLVHLSRREQDKKKLPSLLRMGLNFTQAMTAHVADGMEKAAKEVYQTRLSICQTCESRNGDRCGECGCFITAKASHRTGVCPLGHWENPHLQALGSLEIVQEPVGQVNIVPAGKTQPA